MITQLVIVAIVLLFNKEINFANLTGMLFGVIMFAIISHFIGKREVPKIKKEMENE